MRYNKMAQKEFRQESCGVKIKIPGNKVMKQMEEFWSLGPVESFALHPCALRGLRCPLNLLQSIKIHRNT